MERKIVMIGVFAFVLAAIIMPVAAAPFPVVSGSGVSRMDAGTHKLLEEKYVWTKSDSGQILAAWMKIPTGSDIEWNKAGCTNSLQTGCSGTVQYFAQWRLFTPEGKDWLKDYSTDYYRGLYDTDQGQIYLAHGKFFRGADGTSNSNSGDEYGGLYYTMSDLISSQYKWQGQWTAELYILDANANPRKATRVATQYFTLSDSDTVTTHPTTDVVYPYGTATQTTSPYVIVTNTPTTQTTTASGALPAVIDSGTSTYVTSGNLLQPKTTWTTSDTGSEANIAAWIRISPGTSMADGSRPQFAYRVFTPDGKEWYKDINPSSWKVNVDGQMTYIAQPGDFSASDFGSYNNLEYGEARMGVYEFQPEHNAGKPSYQFNGPWRVDMIISTPIPNSGGQRAYTTVKTLTFNLKDGGTTQVNPPVAGSSIDISTEDFTSADVQKTGATWDSTVEKCPTWRGNDWSGTGDYYLSHGGDTLTYSFTAPQKGTYALWMRDWSDTNHAKGDRQVTITLDGSTVGTFDAANAFNRGTTGYGWDKFTNVDLSAGSHTLKITKKDTTSSAAIVDHILLTPDLSKTPQGAVGHSEALCAGTTQGGGTTTVVKPPVITSACSGTGTSVYAEDRTMQQGSTVKIPIMICNAQDLANMDLVVSYDTSVLKFRSAEKGGLNANSLFESNEASPGTVMISFASSTGNSGSGSIAILTFDVTGSNGSTSPIKITVKTASTSSGSAITVSVSQGTFTTGTPVKVTFDGGPVTSRDALAALQMAVGKIPTDTKYDVTKDGSVNSADARAILKIAVSSQ
jgi:hypothetical protein